MFNYIKSISDIVPLYPLSSLLWIKKLLANKIMKIGLWLHVKFTPKQTGRVTHLFSFMLLYLFIGLLHAFIYCLYIRQLIFFNYRSTQRTIIFSCTSVYSTCDIERDVVDFAQVRSARRYNRPYLAWLKQFMCM